MTAIITKIFATALALSQVTTVPGKLKTAFDPATDKNQVVQLLRAGCSHMRKAFDIEDINLDDLIATALDDPQATTGDAKVFRGIDLGSLQVAYRQFCKNEEVANSPVDLDEVIAFYNSAAMDLPDHQKLRDIKLRGLSVVLDSKEDRMAEVYEPGNRRIWAPITDIPQIIQKAFIAAEDKRFYQHKGIDERALIRAFLKNIASPGRPQGGSSITQQLAKNFLVGDNVTYERKIREIIVATRLEQALSKQRILELYLNSVYLGRGAYGVEMASRTYFGKSAKALTLQEAAILAGLPKGPNYFNSDRHPDRAQERLKYVLERMSEEGFITPEQAKAANATPIRLVNYERIHTDSGRYFVDQVAREAKAVANLDSLTTNSVTVHSTIHPELQRAAEGALQEGLARYELNSGRARFVSAEANAAELIKRLGNDKRIPQQPAWRTALQAVQLPLSDVHWTRAIVVEKRVTKSNAKRKTETLLVGLADGRVLPLMTYGDANQRKLALHDVVYVQVVDARGKSAARAELRIRPQVQGAIVVIENRTGRVRAMVGGFSYFLSQFNRAAQGQRQPGSALKPVTYLAALRTGLQPNTLLRDELLLLPPVGGARNARPEDYWAPRNYDNSRGGAVTLRRALENSLNLPTVQLLNGGIESDPVKSLQRVCELTIQARIYHECVPYYPFVLGAQPVRMLDLAAFYAAVANEGQRPQPYVIETIEGSRGDVLYRNHSKSVDVTATPDPAGVFQLKSILQGVLARGTARQLTAYAPYAAGKTGTSDDENDAWFVGFTNDVTIAVWVGYDNGDGKRKTLGHGNTGAKVAAPIFEQILRAAWNNGIPKVALAPPSAEAARQLVALPANSTTGELANRDGSGSTTEYFRATNGKIVDTYYKLVPREQALALRQNPLGEPYTGEDWDEDHTSKIAPTYQLPTWGSVSSRLRSLWGGEDRPSPSRIDPDDLWGRRQ